MQKDLLINVEKFESLLEHSFIPINPPSDYIDKLRSSLSNPGDISIETRKKASLLVVLSFLSFLVLLIFWIFRRIMKLIKPKH